MWNLRTMAEAWRCETEQWPRHEDVILIEQWMRLGYIKPIKQWLRHVDVKFIEQWQKHEDVRFIEHWMRLGHIKPKEQWLSHGYISMDTVQWMRHRCVRFIQQWLRRQSNILILFWKFEKYHKVSTAPEMSRKNKNILLIKIKSCLAKGNQSTDYMEIF